MNIFHKTSRMLTALLIAGVSSIPASVTITDGAVGALRDSAGNVITLGAVGILVADSDGNGIGDPIGLNLNTSSVGTSFGASGGDLILGFYQAINLRPNQTGFDLSATSFSYSGGFSAGDNLYVLWFPTIANSGDVVANTPYGQFRTAQMDVTSTMGWVAPADGDYSLYSLDATLGGNPAISQSAFSANLTAVPEPSAYALLGVAALGAACLRKRLRRAGVTR